MIVILILILSISQLSGTVIVSTQGAFQVSSDAQHKNKSPCQLLLDMKVHWGSTYVMLKRAEENKDVCIILPLVICS